MHRLTALLRWLGTVATLIVTTCLADTVTLDNGDHVSGTVAKLENGKLVINTSYAGGIKIDLGRIRNLQTDGPMTVVIDNEQRLFGTISGDGREIVVTPTDKSPPTRQATSVVTDIFPGVVTGMEWKKSGHINLGWSSSAGNTEISRTHGDMEIIAQQGMNRYTAGLAINYATDYGAEIESNGLAYAKYDRFFTQKWYAFGIGTFEHDKFRDIRLRSTYGLGSGYQAITSSKTNLALEGSLVYVLTDFYNAPNDQFPALGVAMKFDHYLIPDRLQFFHKTDGYVSLEIKKKSFARAATGLRMPLSDNFVATTEYDVTWDGDPQDDRSSTDRIMLFKVGYKLK